MNAEPLHPIDQLGAALAVEAGNAPVARRVLARLEAAEAEEVRAYRQFAAAVLDTHCGPAPACIPLPPGLAAAAVRAGSAVDGHAHGQ